MLPYRVVAWPSTGLGLALTLTLYPNPIPNPNSELCTTALHYLSCMVAYIYVGVCWVTMRAVLVKEARGDGEF